MNYSAQPISALSLAASAGSQPLTTPALQQAMALKPMMAVQAAGQVMADPLAKTSATTLNPLKSELNPLNPVFSPLSGMKTHTDAELRQVSHKFEAVFMRMMFKEMRQTVQKSNLFGNSQAMEFFETMQDDQLSDKLASAGGFGLGNVIYQRLKQVTVPHLKTFS